MRDSPPESRLACRLPVQPLNGLVDDGKRGFVAGLVAEDGTLALPVLDYEFDYPAEIRTAYAAIKPDFHDTFSPSLSLGLNLGAQLHFLKTVFPANFARTHFIFTYPQYWAWRLGAPYLRRAIWAGVNSTS
ncbi:MULTISPECIES: hypothetical protein [unclassified Brucella]|uniref:hypothetical protein n=1 Tax=unclassified Brucella TaxID=2632610 RepID=UPI001FCEBCC6|nr:MULTISPECIES: hypothetical protein [unclassified Brucella]